MDEITFPDSINRNDPSDQQLAVRMIGYAFRVMSEQVFEREKRSEMFDAIYTVRTSDDATALIEKYFTIVEGE